jgi:hypothetical protein
MQAYWASCLPFKPIWLQQQDTSTHAASNLQTLRCHTNYTATAAPSMLSLPLQYSDADDTRRKRSVPATQSALQKNSDATSTNAGRHTAGHTPAREQKYVSGRLTQHETCSMLYATGKVLHGCCCLPAPGCSSDATLERAQLWWCIWLCSRSNGGRDATALHTRTHAQTTQRACANSRWQHNPPMGKGGAHALAHMHLPHGRHTTQAADMAAAATTLQCCLAA